MRRFALHAGLACAIVLASGSPLFAAGGANDATAHSESQDHPSSPPKEVNGPGGEKLKPPLPQLDLTDTERQKIRAAVKDVNNQIEFKIASTKKNAGFEPKIGDKLPGGLTTQGLPPKLTQELPKLADYKYAKLKGKIVIVNAMSGDIVDVFPES